MTLDFFHYMQDLAATQGKDFLWQPLKDNIVTIHLGLIMKPNDYYSDTFDEGIKKHLPTGLIKDENFEILKSFYKKKPEEEAPKKILIMKDLELGFMIWMICLAIAFAFFVLEHVKYHLFDCKREKNRRQPKLER